MTDPKTTTRTKREALSEIAFEELCASDYVTIAREHPDVRETYLREAKLAMREAARLRALINTLKE